MANKINKIKAAKECGWTDSRYMSFIRSALRKAWMKYPLKFKTLSANRRVYNGEDKRTKWEYQCRSCSGWFRGKDVIVDHIYPAGKLKEFSDLPQFTSTLFCSCDNLQVLCKECHRIKTKEERQK